MPKKPTPRSLDAIQTDYAALCARLGEIVFKRQAMQEEAEEIHRRLGALNLEADAARKLNPSTEK
jgi:hypothetical protein